MLPRDQRRIVEASIRETCEFRRYGLRAVNIRTNHGHCVISAAVKPEKIVNDLKAYSTRHLREAGEFSPDDGVWARGGSTRYLWKPRHVEAAVDHVLFSQGDLPFCLLPEVSED
ncbi:MAG: transposase [Pyrinomonadaceae bacterium]